MLVLGAIADGLRESTGSWADVLRDCKRRGMRAPVVMVGDDALVCGRRWVTCSPRPVNSAAWVHVTAIGRGLKAPRIRSTK